MMGREGISSGEVWLTGRSDFVLVGEVCGFGFCSVGNFRAYQAEAFGANEATQLQS